MNTLNISSDFIGNLLKILDHFFGAFLLVVRGEIVLVQITDGLDLPFWTGSFTPRTVEELDYNRFCFRFTDMVSFIVPFEVEFASEVFITQITTETH